jgi:hypothetical protein
MDLDDMDLDYFLMLLISYLLLEFLINKNDVLINFVVVVVVVEV